MGKLQYIPSFYFYKFADALSQPYSQLNAFKSGLIDSGGNIIGNESSVDPFEYFIIKLKKIFEQLPPGITKYKTGNLFGVMQLFSEEAQQFGLSKDDFNILIEAELTIASGGNFGYTDISEDMTTGSAAGSIGVPADAPKTNSGSVAGFDPKMGDMMTRAGPVNMFGSVEMFTMPSNEFKMFKFSKTYPKSPTGNYLRRLGYRNPQNKIAIKDDESGEIQWLPAPNKKTFVEEFFLKELPILKEKNDLFLDRDELETIVRETGEEPVEPSIEGAKEVLKLQQDALQKATKPAEKFERQTSRDTNLAGGSELLGLMSSNDSSDRNLASNALTLMKHFARSSTSSTRPYDGLLLGRSDDGEVHPILYDAKGERWSAITPTTSKDLAAHFDEGDPFELWSSAIEHGGNIDFEEDPGKIELGNAIAAKIRKSPKFQETARELASTRVSGKYPIITGVVPGRFFSPKQISDVLKGGVDDLKGREFRINRIGRSTSGLRIGDYIPALELYKKNIEEYETQASNKKVYKPKPPTPVYIRPSISTAANALIPTDLRRLPNISRDVYNLNQDDVRANEKMYGADVVERFYRMMRGFK